MKSYDFRKYLDNYCPERLEFVNEFDFETTQVGYSAFGEYYLYLFAEYCVLESPFYGNAMYILHRDNWRELIIKTKTKLLKDDLVVTRIIHSKNWKQKATVVFDALKLAK